ncbi:MAG: CapA family protein [Salinibacter sp.]
MDETAPDAAERLRRPLSRVRRPDDLVVLSLHWGPNWDDHIPEAQRRLAHTLIDEAGVDVVHGHSAHHVKGIELYRGRPIFYGCGDLLTDYEGIGGHERFRPDLGLMYFPTLDATTGSLLRLEMHPVHMEQFQLWRAGSAAAAWLADRLIRDGSALNRQVEREGAVLTLTPD